MNPDKKTFCILPWIHLNVWPNGNVYQCCLTSHENTCGSTRTSTLEEIWNNDYMRGLRVKLMNGEKHQGCVRCYELEDAGINSFRQSVNQSFAHHVEQAQATTDPDGFSHDFKLAYWDFRFSNLCNFKCRMCGHDLSSSWYDDMQRWFEQDGKVFPGSKVININDNSQQNIDKYLDQFAPVVEEIYFAGGEPLIMDEHYFILDRLLELGRTGVKLRYNTNLSKLTYRRWDVMEYWRKFESVKIFASIDAVGPVGEYIRKGTRWSTIDANIRRIVEYNPDILGINITTQLLNIHHLPETLDYLLAAGVKYHMILFNNVLTYPKYYSTQILSPELKTQVAELLMNHAASLPAPVRDHFMPQYQGVIEFMNQTIDNASNCKRELRMVTSSLDGIREENFLAAFPELAAWYQQVE